MPSFTKALPRLGGGLVPKPAVSVTDSGKSDLLMRFFESEWFDAWIALTYVVSLVVCMVMEWNSSVTRVVVWGGATRVCALLYGPEPSHLLIYVVFTSCMA